MVMRKLRSKLAHEWFLACVEWRNDSTTRNTAYFVLVLWVVTIILVAVR